MKLDATRSLRAVSAYHAATVLAAAGNKREACRQLGISYHTLGALLVDYRALEARTLGERVQIATDAMAAALQSVAPTEEVSDAATS